MEGCAHLCRAMLLISDAFHKIKAGLLHLYDEGEASAIAHSLLEHITGLDRLSRLSQKSEVLSQEQEERFDTGMLALLTGTPLQYVTGEAYFLGKRFVVSPAVLIPRPETEELAQWIIDDRQGNSILDIGTGSGCIAISLKLAMSDKSVTAIDVSQDALAVAQKNASNLGADIGFKAIDFLNRNTWRGLGSFDIIVSNPPYIPASERETLHPNVRDHEPDSALFVLSDDALLFYDAIAQFGKQHLSNEGAIYCELHRDYAEDTARLFASYGYQHVQLASDMHGAPRMLRARGLQ